MEVEVETEAGRRPLNLQGRFMSQKHEPYVRFADKFPHFGSPSAAVHRQMFRRPRPRPRPAPAAASHEPLLTTTANAQGSNGGVSFAGAASASAHSAAAHNNNY